MPIDQPPAIIQPNNSTGTTRNIAVLPASKTVLIITADGKTMRGDREVKDLPREELLVVIDELIDLIRRPLR